MNNEEREAKEKFGNLKKGIADLKSVLVAFSGGVDSTFLLKAARDVLGKDKVLAATALSATTARQERSDAEAYARAFDVEHVFVKSSELDNPDFTKNPADKCYICKKIRFRELVELAKKRGFDFVADGENADDAADYRPGSRAAGELGVRSPLREAGLTKRDIRTLSRKLGLSSWNKPSFACLASRIPYGRKITPEKLRQVDEGERFLRDSGFSPRLRLRHYGDTARIELDENDFRILVDAGMRARVVQYIKSLGFQFVALDLEGYSMGSLNRSIGDYGK